MLLQIVQLFIMIAKLVLSLESSGNACTIHSVQRSDEKSLKLHPDMLTRRCGFLFPKEEPTPCLKIDAMILHYVHSVDHKGACNGFFARVMIR